MREDSFGSNINKRKIKKKFAFLKKYILYYFTIVGILTRLSFFYLIKL